MNFQATRYEFSLWKWAFDVTRFELLWFLPLSTQPRLCSSELSRCEFGILKNCVAQKKFWLKLNLRWRTSTKVTFLDRINQLKFRFSNDWRPKDPHDRSDLIRTHLGILMLNKSIAWSLFVLVHVYIVLFYFERLS